MFADSALVCPQRFPQMIDDNATTHAIAKINNGFFISESPKMIVKAAGSGEPLPIPIAASNGVLRFLCKVKAKIFLITVLQNFTLYLYKRFYLRNVTSFLKFCRNKQIFDIKIVNNL